MKFTQTLVLDLTQRINATDDNRDSVAVYKTPGVVILGHHFKPGCCLVLEYHFDLPVFVVLRDIIT